ncbi:MAG TPA: hypothetical protein VKS81_05460 [Bacteroidota bacterium]|nr:hypothetical protein [Bacteroidota bacterium]
MPGRTHIARLIAVILALNYFAFSAEIFDREYAESHPALPGTISISVPTVTWETFDKENAQAAFVFDANIQLATICKLPAPPCAQSNSVVPSELVRDKSPPRRTAGLI